MQLQPAASRPQPTPGGIPSVSALGQAVCLLALSLRSDNCTSADNAAGSVLSSSPAAVLDYIRMLASERQAIVPACYHYSSSYFFFPRLPTSRLHLYVLQISLLLGVPCASSVLCTHTNRLVACTPQATLRYHTTLFLWRSGSLLSIHTLG